LALAVAVLLYIVTYYYSDVRPRVDGRYPLGWWGWFDQGEYIKSVRAFASLNFNALEHLYPPLYALIASPFVLASKDHPFFIPNLIFFAFYVFVFLRVLQKYYGPYLPAVVLVCILGFLPVISITQWIIPWTTSLQAALVSGLILIFFRFESKDAPFRVGTRADWLCFAGFFILYGALAPTRPLDILVCFPFALNFFIRAVLATAGAAPPGLSVRTASLCFMVATIGGLIFVSFYLLFNFLTFGSFFGAYLGVASKNPYLAADILEKAYSIFLSSGEIYGERGQAFLERIPAAAPVLAVCIAAIGFLNGIRRWIILTALLHFVIYLPYGDLLPTGIFRYYNLHYFKWAYPWLAVIAAGQTWRWLTGAVTHGKGVPPLAVSAVLLVALLAISIAPVEAERVKDLRSQDESRIIVRVSREWQADFVDLLGVEGGFTDLYFGAHKLRADNAAIAGGSFRVLPIGGGARLLFLRPLTFTELELSLDQKVRMGPNEGVSIVTSYGYTFGCRFRECSQFPAVAWSGRSIQIDFRSMSTAQGLDLPAWWGPEPWGRWSKEAAAAVELRIEPRPAVSVSAVVIPLLGAKRPTQSIALLANGCRVSSVEFSLADAAPKTVKGRIPTGCIRADGRLRLELQTDTAQRPVKLGINQDRRRIGVGVSKIVLRSSDRGP
jgi:hypothetical protein